jgi:nucleotide-binding universal stress UspA family protein
MYDSNNASPRTVQDFIAARRQAAYEMFLARLTGRSTALLSYEDVRAKLRALESSGQVLREIPLDAIVGSVGRYTDFTRSFLPKSDSDRQRWSQVKAIADGLTGFPPIEVYQIGETYFVRDGNHRVSVTRQSGATHVQAYVTVVRSNVPLEPDVQPDDLILKAEYAEFLEQTSLRSLRPEADIPLTVPGKYRTLLEHIEVHRYFMGITQQRSIAYEEAVADWYDRVYQPMVNAIRARGILSDFPERTEGDLYLWVSEHRHLLQEDLKVAVPASEAAADLAAQFSPQPRRVAARLGSRIYDWLTPDEFEGGPRPGHWRRERLEIRTDSNQIFPEVLIALGDRTDEWESLDQAIRIASQEGSHIHGLHVTKADPIDTKLIETLRSDFLDRCAQAGLGGTFHYESGKIARRICYWARWMDLVVLSLNHPPQPSPIRRFSSGFRTILQRCPRPVLAVPTHPSKLQRALVAFDGSPKAREALYLAAYLNASWEIPLQVLYVQERDRPGEKIMEEAHDQLAHHHQVEFQVVSGKPEEAILATAGATGADLILMGGYTASPWVEVLLGSTVERLLRRSTIPLLICR